jgi:outer membrane protein assembly factor BamB
MSARLILALLFALSASGAAAEDWPQFRGPTGQGHSTEQNIPFEWSETRNVVWKVPVPGSGWSSPVVANGKVWMTAAMQVGKSSQVSLRALAFDAESGKELVNAEMFRREATVINIKNSRTSPTPILDGDRVYVHFGADGTAALSSSGELLWKTQFRYDSEHGNGGSPILFGDLLILNCDGFDQAFVVALDTRTGKVRWKTSRRQPWSQAYSTPLAMRVADQDQVVSAGAFRATAYDPLSGKEIWRVNYEDGFSNVARPVYGQGLVFISTGFNEPALIAVRPDGKGDITRTNVAWTLERGAPLTPSPLVVDDVLYVVSDIGIATALDAKTGKPHWQQRLGGNYSASPVFADGRIYFQSEEGLTTVIAPGTAFTLLARNELDGATLASLAVSGGSIYIRSNTHLYRIGATSRATEARRVVPAQGVRLVQVAGAIAPGPAEAAQSATPEELVDRAMKDFASGRIEESIRGFDEVAKLAPRAAPQLWQRGIALYYAGRYRDCRRQFEDHRSVNPNDVENAAWHFICVARGESVRFAREDLLPVGADPRVPMRQIYDMLRDSLSPEGVIAAAKTDPEALFFAHLYVGLYYEATGNKARALEHITEATAERYAAVGGYMHAVARVHLAILQGSLQPGK